MKTKDMTKEQALHEIELLKKRIDFNNRLNKFVRSYMKDFAKTQTKPFNGYNDSPTEDMIKNLIALLSKETWMSKDLKNKYLYSCAAIYGQVYSPAVNTYILKDLHDCEKYIQTFDNAILTGDEENDVFSVERDVENNRINLYFDYKPEENIRTILKRNGFRWSPSYSCWTRQLTDEAEKSLQRIKNELL